MLQRIYSSTAYTIDQYHSFGWVTLYQNEKPDNIKELEDFGITSAVMVKKPKGDSPSKPEVWFGNVPSSLIVGEHGVKYEIRCLDTFHPGLFLDHQLTRKWIKENTKNKTILNLFSYTGSLAIAGAVGGAKESMSIDLSNQTTLWAKQNALLNNLGAEHQFIKGDVFDWMKRFKKKDRKFDLVISDPPSQSRSDLMHFSTQKHLDMLHELCIDAVAPKGTLITSINTEIITHDVLVASVHHMAENKFRKIKSYDILPLSHGFVPDFRAMKGIRVVFAN